MKIRLFSLFTIITSLIIPIALVSPAQAISCANETHMNMRNGKYTTTTTKQYSGTGFVQMDAWSPDSTLQQNMDVCSTAKWDAIVTETNTTNPRVVTYPDSEYRFTDYVDCTHSPDWSTLNHLSSSWELSAPNKGDYDESYDMFFGGTINGHNCGQFQEVMIYTKWHGNVYAPPAMENFTTKDGQNYDVIWNADHSYVQVRMTSQAISGVARIKQVLNALTNISDASGPIMNAHGEIMFVQYGVEVVSGTQTAVAGPIPFHLTKFAVTAN